MRLHRFFARNLSGSAENDGTTTKQKIEKGSTVTYQDDSYQWQRVFRYGRGDQVILFDGTGKDYVCEIQSLQGEIPGVPAGAVLHVVEIRENNIKPVRQVILVAAVVKRDTFEWIAEKATELGIAEIIPVIAERSEKKSLNMERLQKIIIEASEQSGRGEVPVLHEVTNLSDIIKDRQKDKEKIAGAIVFEPHGRNFIEKDFAEKRLIVFVGPEGGWSPEEIKSFVAADIPLITLGPQTLRAETAAIAGLARVIF